MILTVTLNLALDVTYEVPRLVPHHSHRVNAVHARAGGKGINVARVLRRLGETAVVTGFAGGATGSAVRADLVEVIDALVPVAGETRRTVAVVSTADGDATVLNEPGPVVSPEEWAAFLTRYAQLLADADVVVLSGSLPPGLAGDAYAVLVRLAREHGVLSIVDTSGDPLRAAVAARPDLVKPNAVELFEVTGETDHLAAAGALRTAGAGAVAASLGGNGLLLSTVDGSWLARVPEPLRGNPTGAGDACVAALAAGLRRGEAWPDVLAEATAVSAAAVLAPVAGEIDVEARRGIRPTVHLEELSAAHTDS
ncbi:tagatose 6-phosphate kinase [Herbihabitans rhizosphaerae]|uniref:Tagatose 6-phosphate kinase n=1 Tax=Herbihabitans rhizosphaerae TaxID=1872711 RepID=A0A4Q7L675_9PSEU|nr:1-phosphofructokinase family hexose kinase [Herbihabitans rhizosphaerae]RZS44837.1 tagatose 6-phosphate kinase [Herbihabitans rhizosphaerae]